MVLNKKELSDSHSTIPLYQGPKFKPSFTLRNQKSSPSQLIFKIFLFPIVTVCNFFLQLSIFFEQMKNFTINQYPSYHK